MTVRRRLPESQIRAQICEALEAGRTIEPDSGDLSVLRPAYSTWNKRNELLLERGFEKGSWLDSTPKDDYMNALGLMYPLGPELAEDVSSVGLVADIASAND